MSTLDLDPVESATLQENALRDSILPTEIPAGFFQGVGTGILNGLKSGDYRVKADQAFNDTPEQMQQRYQVIKSLKPDPTTIGMLGNLGFNLGEFTAVSLENFLSGDIAPPLLAKSVASTYEKTSTELNVMQGMDRATAANLAKTEGIFQGLGLVAPAAVAGNFATRAASGSAIQSVMGAAQRGTMSYQLDKAGYPEMAAQYKVFDAAAIMTDLILGGGIAGLVGPRANRPISFREHTTPNEIDALLTMNQAAHIEVGTAPGMPITPEARQAHVDAHEKALMDLINGDPVDVGTRVTEVDFLPHPEMDAARMEIGQAIADHIRSIPGADQAFSELESLKAMARDRGLVIDEPVTGDTIGAAPEEITRQIQQHLSTEFGKDANSLLDAGKVKIVSTVNDLPVQNAPADVKGMYHDGVSYLVASNVSKPELRGLVLHEVGVHAGMKDMLGDSLYTKLINTVNNSNDAIFVKARKAAEELAAKPEHIPEETLAYLVENHQNHKIVKQLLSAVRQWLYRATNGKLVKLTDSDIAAMAVSSLRRYARQSEATKNGTQSLYSRNNKMSLADVKSKWDELGIDHFISERNGVIRLDKIIVPKETRNNGIGTKALNLLVQYADNTNQRIILDASSDFGGNVKKLNSFYKRFGFFENKGRNKDYSTTAGMIREPTNQDIRYSRKTVNVDGVERPMLNSEGRPIANDETSIKNFWKWFGDSKVVDNEGKPLVVYHGTPNGNFNQFEISRSGERTDYGNVGLGIYTTPARFIANAYAGKFGETMSIYSSIKNPLKILYDENFENSIKTIARSFGITENPEWKNGGVRNKEFAKKFGLEARARGFDGAFTVNSDGSIVEAVAYSPEQIKSATGNTGTFDPANPDIRYSRQQSDRKAGEQYTAKGIVAEKPDMTIAHHDGSEIPATDALRMADENIQTAKSESKAFNVAVTCSLRN